MPDIADGGVFYVQGSGKTPYELKNVGGVYSCSCPAWRNVGGPIDRRTCKHLKAHRGADVELARIGGDPGQQTAQRAAGDASADAPTTGAADAPPVLLAHTWTADVDLTGWWMSEKLDGLRAWWDGRRFQSRLGNAFFAPEWFTAGLPGEPLDGELWVGRKAFTDAVSIVRRQDGGEQWRRVRFLVFDAPGRAAPFEERVAWIAEWLGNNPHPHAEAVRHARCEGVAHLRAELARVEALGGEGLMLRQPGSRYEAGRSTTLLKVKTFHDAEARVVGHDAGKGRHLGRLGALVLEMADGTRFNVGTGFSDAERGAPPPIGALVTYRYQELSRDGVPRFPTYVGVAIDKAGPTVASAAILPIAGAAVGAPAVGAPALGAPALGVATAPAVGARRFELVDGASNKFWEVSQAGAEVRTRYGRIGATGQTTVKAEPDAGRAAALLSRLVAEKVGKGYREV